MCGVFGVYAPDRDVARLTYFGLFALQHRGQESAGIAVSEHGRVTALRDLGLVTQVFDEQKLHGLRGQVAIGHTRYSTTGSSQWANAQPLVEHGRGRTVALGHNGNLVNAGELREELRAEGVALRSTSDSELIAALIANDEAPLEEAVAGAMRRLEGAYSVVALAEGRLVAFRDEHGFRPLVLGRIRRAGSVPGEAADAQPEDPAASADLGPVEWVVASETCALDLVGAELVRDLAPGELVVAGPDGLRTIQALDVADGGALCIFEFFYLARPDTRLDGVEVHGARVRMGERLAAEAPVEADLVLPIPDSGTPAAIGFSRALGIPFSEGLIKNRYVGRTFIQPDQELRRQGIRLKFNPLAEVAGKRVVVVDDSIVRGNTTREIVRMLFDAGAAEVHVRVSSPPVIGRCFYGIDLADPEEMVASRRTVEEVREHIGATSLAYLSHDGLVEATGRPTASLCRACLTGDYPTAVPAEYAKLRFEPASA
jgi:amidophosphoribosyltransferase